MPQRILLTGMSGTGKSTIIGELRARGYRAVDMDEPGWSVYGSEGDWRWHEPRIRDLLTSITGDELLFVSGCAENQGQFYPLFEHVILLSAPTEVIIYRLRTRTTNDYGKDPAELAETLGYIETVEPLLRGGADFEIDTTVPIDEVIAQILTVLKPDSNRHR